MKLRRIIVELIVLSCYLALTLILTYPLALNMSTHVIGEVDVWHIIWNLWWVKKALIELHTNPYYTYYIYYPTGTTLLASELVPFKGLLSIPLQYLFGLTVSYNLMIIFSFVVSGYGMYLLVDYLTKDKRAAFIAGLVFTFSPYHQAHALGHLNLTSTEWIPFYVLYMIKTFRERHTFNAVLAAFFFLLTLLCTGYYFGFLVVLTLLYVLFQLIANRSEFIEKHVIKRFMLMVVLCFLLVSPLLLSIRRELNSHEFIGLHNPVEFSADLTAFFTPTVFHPILGRFFLGIYDTFTGNHVEDAVYIGYTVLTLGFYALLNIRTKEVKFWGTSAIVFFILSLGPYLHIFGKVYKNILLPPILLYKYLLFFSFTGVPSRFSVMVMFSLAIISGYAIQNILSKITHEKIKTILSSLIAFLILFEFLSVPVLMSKVETSSFYKELALDKRDYAILEVPLERNARYYGIPEYLYYQTIHNKKIVGGGYVSRTPKYAVDYLTKTPLLRDMFGKQSTKDILIQNYSEIGNVLLDYLNVKYVVLHESFLDGRDFERIKGTLDEVFTKPLRKEKDMYIYLVEDTRDIPFMLLGDGWGELNHVDGRPQRRIEDNGVIKIISRKPASMKMKVDYSTTYSLVDVLFNNKSLGIHEFNGSSIFTTSVLNVTDSENNINFHKHNESEVVFHKIALTYY